MGELGIGEGDGAAEEIAEKLPGTTAVICSNDMQAFGVLRRLAQLGCQIPGDISVVGFDDVSMATLTFPPLTTINVDRIAFGRLAVELLMSRVQCPGRPTVRCTMAVSLIHRSSVAAPLATYARHKPDICLNPRNGSRPPGSLQRLFDLSSSASLTPQAAKHGELFPKTTPPAPALDYMLWVQSF